VLSPVVQHRNSYVAFSILTSRSLSEVFTIREIGIEAELDRFSMLVGRVAIPRSDDIHVERVEIVIRTISDILTLIESRTNLQHEMRYRPRGAEVNQRTMHVGVWFDIHNLNAETINIQ